MSNTSTTTSTNDLSSSYRAAYAKHILNEHLLAKLNDRDGSNRKTLPADPLLPADKASQIAIYEADPTPYNGRICIIGAGASGLYTAMMLKYLGIKNVDILEANNRVGGRCYTYDLPGDKNYHNYYDIGAMRIPKIPWMEQTLNFISDKKHGLGLELAKYIYSNKDVPKCYWYQNTRTPDENKFAEFMKPIMVDFMTNFDSALKKWMGGSKDSFSTRAFLMAGPKCEGAPCPPWKYEETANAEISDTSTGLFDQSFTETVIDYADFQAADSKPWFRVEGGMQRVTDAMRDRLASANWPHSNSSEIKIQTSSPVIKMSHNEQTNKIGVTVAGREPEEYDMVFNSTAMGPLQQMDLQGLKLPDHILTGIRSLSYDRATKVAIRFKKAWWNPKDLENEIYGGASRSDLPISNVVYPSWNDGENAPAVLIVSYSWAQDATRMASLVPDYTLQEPKKTDRIVSLCFDNLVKLWDGRPNAPTIEFLYDNYMSHHAWAWEHDPWTGGAFALFGPGQFKSLYPAFNELFCNKKFAMCGEALSAHHAWISGALDSAYVKVMMFLESLGRQTDKDRLEKSIFGGGKGENPDEMDWNLVRWSVALSEGGEEETAGKMELKGRSEDLAVRG